MRKTKIVCTLGPASSDEKTMEQMLKSGMNVARVNFSHGTHETQQEVIIKFRKVRDKLGYSAAIILDTKGPEIRLKNFENGMTILDDEQEFTLSSGNELGTKEMAAVTYKNLAKELKPGIKILIDDGKVSLKVLEIDGDKIKCKVIHGGKISNHKGVNIPNANLQMEYLSKQDKSDILFGIENGIDFVAASFVRKKEDIQAIRKFLDGNGGEKIKLISKIENTEGVSNFEDILKFSDGIMVARGDMGVEVPYEKLPGIQKKFILRCKQSGKIVITATQMLESMISSPMPTRAEITDVANAVFDGTTAVMLSGESAAGEFPIEAVMTMAKIAEQAEEDDPKLHSRDEIWHEMDALDTTNAVGHAACLLANDIKANAIIAITKTGYTAMKMSKFRPNINIIAYTPYEKTFHQLSLAWGVVPQMGFYKNNLEELFKNSIKIATKDGLLKKGDKVVISAGMPLDVSGNTNLIKVEIVD